MECIACQSLLGAKPAYWNLSHIIQWRAVHKEMQDEKRRNPLQNTREILKVKHLELWVEYP